MSDTIELSRSTTPNPVGVITPKQKRTYVRKVKVVLPEPIPTGLGCSRPTPEPVQEPTPEPVQEPVQEPTPEPTPEPTSEPIKEKKPRSEKQIAAFARMREARIKKQEELTVLKDLQKHQVAIDKEQVKIDKLEDQIVKRKASKPRPKKIKAESEEEPEYNLQKLSNYTPIMFV
jgi:hypothetical protein